MSDWYGTKEKLYINHIKNYKSLKKHDIKKYKNKLHVFLINKKVLYISSSFKILLPDFFCKVIFQLFKEKKKIRILIKRLVLYKILGIETLKIL